MRLAAIVAVLAVASCSKKQDEGQELSNNPIAAVGQLAAAADKAAEAAKEAEAMMAKGPVNPVHFDKLVALLPAAPASFTAGEARGETTAMGEFKMSTAQRDYSGGEKNLHVTITDGAFNPMVYAGVTMAAQFARESSEGYEKGVTLDGNPGFEKWHKANNDSELTLVVAKRFLVTIRGDNVGPEAVRALWSSMDKSALAALQ